MNIRQITLPLYEAKGWMRFFAVVSIIWALISALISGVVTASIGPSIGVVSILISSPLELWAGVLVFQVANKIDSAHIDEDAELLLASLKKLKTFFIISGVLIALKVLMALSSF